MLLARRRAEDAEVRRQRVRDARGGEEEEGDKGEQLSVQALGGVRDFI